jgi:hypothetical protein
MVKKTTFGILKGMPLRHLPDVVAATLYLHIMMHLT